MKKRKMWRTPTAIDSSENAERYAARLVMGKKTRSSNHKVQETLSIQVFKEILSKDPGRVKELLQDEMVHRPRLPAQEEFVTYLRSQTNAKKLSEVTGIDYTTVEHWFRHTKYFSYPSKQHWNIIKKYLDLVKYDKEMNYDLNKEWK
jgi:hypothetical protein